MKNFKKFFKFFGNKKKVLLIYFVLSLIAGVMELFGVALTYPFVLKLLSGDNYKNKLTIIIGISIVLLFIFKNVIMAFYTRYQATFTKNLEKEINLKFMQYFLISKYSESSKLSFAEKNNITSLIVPSFVNNYVLRIQNLGVNIFIFSLIALLLFIKFTFATIITMIFAVILIVLQNKIFKPQLKKISQKIMTGSVLYGQAVNEALLNVKGVKISNNEKFFYDNYESKISELYKNQRDMMFLQLVPPYITEPLIILLLFILLAIISFQNYDSPQRLVASFAVIVSAIFRLAPAISRIQTNLNGIASSTPMVTKLFKLYEEKQLTHLDNIERKNFCNFNDKLELKNVYFEYTKGLPILNNINLTIKKGEFIGIAGLSGAGKTTLIDIISGLLHQTQGTYLVDGKPYEKPLKCGYIPQEFITINASIRENVGFGVEKIDDNRVIEVLKQAQLYDFIINTFKEGIYANPFVDSTGFSLGQKQRLAIARAMYSDPDIIILDEATSSLDLKTENEVCSTLKMLKGTKTIIAVAHRLSTIKSADKIAFLRDGKIENFAPFEELMVQNPHFMELVRLASLKN